MSPVMLVVAAFSRHPDALVWANQKLTDEYGPVVLASEPYVFDQTAYYEPSMGKRLVKHLWAFERLIAAERLPSIKRATIAMERACAETAQYPDARPINLDPGYLNLGKFVLASTKDNAHRLYLNDGIFGEVTLFYQGGEYRPWPWTYADYRQECVLRFLGEARLAYRRRKE